MMAKEDGKALYFIRQAMIGAILIPPTFLSFILKFNQIQSRLNLINLVFVIFFLSFSFSKFFIAGVEPRGSFSCWPIPGPIFHPMLIFFAGNTFAAHVILYKQFKLAMGTKKLQLLYIFLGTLIGFIGGSTNYFLWYHINIPPVLNPLVSVYIITVTYAILRHKLLDIEVIIKKTLVFAGLFGMAMAVISVVSTFTRAYVGRYIAISNDVSTLVSVFIAILFYSPTRNLLVSLTDKYLFQKKINYRLLLREASEYLAHVSSLRQQSRTIVAFLLKKARVANASIYAFSSTTKEALILHASRPVVKDGRLIAIKLSHPIVKYFGRQQGPIEIQTFQDKKTELALHAEDFDEILALMKSLKAEAAIPCYGGEAVAKFDKKTSRLKGILFLGHQKSDEPYSEEDLDVFFTLGQESSIAFENARLYDEAVNRSIELQKMNEELKRTHTALLEEKKRAVLAGIGKSVAHEVNNPLTPLAMNIHFVKQLLDRLKTVHETFISEPSDKNQRKFQEILETAKIKLLEAEKGKDRIKGIIQTLRDLVRPSTGEKKEKKGVQIKMVVVCAIEEVKYQTYWETLSAPDVAVVIPAELPLINGIAEDLQGFFVNLFVNALHALSDREKDKKITITAEEDKEKPEMIRIEFSDNGCGMTPEVLAKCFEHGYTTKGAKGTGIGLFYCKYIIEEVHGGTIEAKSQVGIGTTFTIRLPRFQKGTE